MKAVLVTYIAIASTILGTLTAQGLNEDQLTKVRKYREECVAETQVDPELIDRADGGDFVDDSKLKCFSKCFYQKAGFVDSNGELLLDVIKAKIPKGQDKEKALATIEKCKDLKGADSCETVYLVHKCYFENSAQNDNTTDKTEEKTQ